MRILRILAMVLVSLLLFVAAFYAIKHGSSSAFQLGLGCAIAGIIHPIFWPHSSSSK